MTDQNSLIAWKTQAWTNPDMVAWYAMRMTDSSGTNPLKNRVERHIVDRCVIGQDILDVGIGTGRGSLPLARRGYRVTGIDSSQAMLDETRRQAAETPIELRQGDVRELPVADAAFDTLISLNVMVHFPHWQPVLQEWKRVVRPGGRMLFDIHSLDHLEAALPAEQARQIAEAGLHDGAHGAFMSHMRVEDLTAWCSENGLRVLAVIPVGGFFGPPAYNHWIKPLEDRFAWKRLLSWLGHDNRLLDFAVFLEESFPAFLTSRSTCRFFALLENTDAPAENAAWLAKNRQLNERLTNSRRQPDAVLPHLFDTGWQQALCHHLAWPRNRQMLYQLLSELCQRFPQLNWRDTLPPAFVDLFDDWLLQEQIDDATLAMIRTWTTASVAGESLTHKGVPLAPGLEYHLMEALLTRHFGVFSGNRT